MKQLLFHSAYVDGLFASSGARHTNIPDDFDQLFWYNKYGNMFWAGSASN